MVRKINIGGIACYRIAVIAALMAGVLWGGVCPAEPAQVSSASALGNKDVAKAETAVGDLMADAVRKAVHTDIAFVAASELKSKDVPFPAGKVSSEDIAGLISYPDDSLTVLELKGKLIRQALERALSIYPQPNLGFLQVSGLKFSCDPSRPCGERVMSVSVGSSQLGDDISYSVAVTNSMANGALGYWKVWNQDNVTRRVRDSSLAKALDSYLKSTPAIDYTTLDRITFPK